MTREEIIDNIARLNSETWRDREETRTEIGKLLAELNKALEQQPCDEIGVWVEERDDYGKVNAWHCSNCYERTGFYTDYASNFCCECGVKKIGIVKSDEDAKKFLEKRGNEK